MLSRCTNPNVPQYHRYGGRGIKVCARWLIFENFLADMGEKPDELSLDRKDNDKDYCPENCRWATGKEQGRNKSTNVMWEYRGESKTISEWAESLGMDRHTLGDRVRKSGWTITQALETPVQTKAQIAAKVNKIRWGPLPQVRTD
jgi:hypothetical protein